MTFKTPQEIYDLLKANPNRARIFAYREESKKLRMLIYGDGLKEMLETLPGFERDEMFKLRKQLTRSVVDLFERILVQRNKVFTAKGGSKAYDLPDSQIGTFRGILNNVRKGLSIEEWIQKVALAAYDTDPMSITFMEINPATGIPYPTYKGTDNIFDYEHDGRKIEYVVFSLTIAEVGGLIKAGVLTDDDKNKTIFRVVDDSLDYIVRKGDSQGGTEYNVVKTYPNHFGSVPAIINSNEFYFRNNQFVSSIWKIKDLTLEYLTDCSTKIIAKKYQMYPREWGPRIDCTVCNGEGIVDGERCTKCQGSGEKQYLQVAERISMPLSDDGTMKGSNQPGGFITPPTEAWEAMNNELDKLETMANHTFWGATSASQTNGMRVGRGGEGTDQATATSNLLNEQPKQDKFKMFSRWAQETEKFVTDRMGMLVYPTSYKGSTIIYGDRYLLESADELMKQYEKLRSSGAPAPALDSALIDVYEAKYNGNPKQLRIHMLLMYVEPFVHCSVKDVQSLPIPDEIKRDKIFFSEWLQTISDVEIITSDEAMLRTKLREYAKQFELVKPEPAEPILIN